MTLIRSFNFLQIMLILLTIITFTSFTTCYQFENSLESINEVSNFINQTELLNKMTLIRSFNFLQIMLILLTIITFTSFTTCYQFENSLESINEVSNFINQTELLNSCEEGEFDSCYSRSTYFIDKLKFANRTSEVFNNPISIRKALQYNNFLASLYFYVGEIEYFGLIKKKPNLIEGFRKLAISAFYGNPAGMYKMYILLETNIISTVINTNEVKNMVEDESDIMSYIKTTPFFSNLEPFDEYARKSISFNFLYASAISKYNNALTTMGHKYLKGYGVSPSCETALKYYKEVSSQNVKEIHRRMKPNYYEKVSIASFEYIGHKYSAENQMDITDVIDYFKVEAANGNIQYIQQLGQRFLYGQGIGQDFDQSFYYFNMGMELDDALCIFYLGELYLNGWGTEKNFKMAFELYTKAQRMNSAKASNSLGYMYYYGLGVDQNVKKAYDLFKSAINKGDEADAYFNLATLLVEGNEAIKVDVSSAYKYANFITSKGHTFGTHIFGMLNQYQLGSIIKTCEITIEFFKAVSERNLNSKRKFDYGIQAYKEGNYKVSALIHAELAEEGHEFGQVNAGLLFKNYNIFIDQKINNFLSFKYFKMAQNLKNIFATLQIADFYLTGYGELPPNHDKAYKLYQKVVTTTSENNFYNSHAYFHLGKMNHYGLGIPKNTTKALRFYNQSSIYEENAIYPTLAMKYLIFFEDANLTELFLEYILSFGEYFSFSNPITIVFFVLVSLYIAFIVDLKMQSQ